MRLSGPPVVLDQQISFDLAMVVHELATNAAKYGALSSESGIIEITWTPEQDADTLRVAWQERGGPRVEPPQSSGLGSRVIRQFPTSHPSAEVSFEPEGLRWVAWIPGKSFKRC